MKCLEFVLPQNVKLNIDYHDTLNPAIWNGLILREDVEERLTTIALKYQEYIGLSDLTVVDWIITGSNANYNWTSVSDIDLHLVVDMSNARARYPELIDDFLAMKRKIWNDLHNITIRSFQVELYTQDTNEIHIASGVYSLKNQKWILSPKHNKPTFNNSAVRAKAAVIMNQIDKIHDAGCANVEEIDVLRNKVSKMRKAGLEKAGEFSIENLTFKTLRNNGYLKKMFDCYNSAYDSNLSLTDNNEIR